MIKLYGNEIWNSNTPNQYKKVIIASESQFESITDALENAGLNYCGYMNNNKSYVAVGRATVSNLDKLNISYDSIVDSNNRKYVTNNIIGTAKYNDIGDKMYRKYNTDFAYKVAQRLTEQDIPFSGRIFGKNTTITVDNTYKDAINAIAHEIREQRELLYKEKAVEKNEQSATVQSSVTVSEEDNTENLFNALSVLHYKAPQLESLNSAVELLDTRPELIDLFSTMFEDTSDFKPEQLNMLSMNFVKTYSGLSDSELILANIADFNEIKQSFINTNLADKLIENRGYSYAQSELIRAMVDMGIDYDTINLLDYTFSLTEMQTFIGAYSRSDYDSLINLVAKVKGVTRSEVEGMISDGTYTPALPDFNTLEKTLYFQESEVESITYMYYNPDAYSGGQFVITEVSYELIAEAYRKYGNDYSNFFDFLDTTGEQRLIDVGSESFRTTVKKFYSGTEFAEGLNADIQHKLVELAVVPEIKSPEVRKIELIKVGDFYEVRGENAKTVADILDLVSTTRNINGSSVDTVGFPDFKLNDNTELLKTQGFTVNIKYEELAQLGPKEQRTVPLAENDYYNSVVKQDLKRALYHIDNAKSDAERNFYQNNFDIKVRNYAGALNVSSEEIVNQFNLENEIVPINEPERTEPKQAAEYPEKESNAEKNNNNTELNSIDELAMQLENDEKSTSEKSSVGKNNFIWTSADEHAPVTSQPTLFDSMPVSDVSSDETTSHENYVLEDRESVTGAKTKYRNNITAIKVLKQIEADNRTATPEEQKQLSRYSGWGGLANAFESDNDKWKNEYSELKGLLTDDEYTAARSSVLDAFFTDSVIIDSIYKVMQNAGFKGGNILEPAMGIGNFFGRLPSELRENSKLYGVVFATGTPLSNSVTELHTMMRYLNYDFLASHNNMQNFDNWVSTFGTQKKEYELAPAGNKFKERTRIAEYANLPEFMSMFKMIADVRTADTLNLKVPDCELHIVDVEPTELQTELVEELSDRADGVNNGSVDPSQDNMLKITGDGRKLGLDPRLIDPSFDDDPGTKLNVCVNNVFDIYDKTSEKKLTQIIFCDLGVPGKNSSADSKDDDIKSVAELDSLEESGKFCVYDDIRDKLIAKGVPADEIAYIHSAKTETQKSELFAKVRSGEVRILLGSTSKMGTGTNVQDKIIALHDLDVPWRPSDLEQRRGRMVRQGNINEKVHLYRYVTKGTFDAYSYQILEKKQKFISQVMTSKAPGRKCTDVDQAALTYSEIKALCTGDERIREKLTLENRVKELQALKSEYSSTKYELEDKVNAYPEARKKLLMDIGNVSKDLETVKSIPYNTKDGNYQVEITLGADTYSLRDEEARKAATKALTNAFAQVKGDANKNKRVNIGQLANFGIEVINDGYFLDKITATLRGNYAYSVELGVSNPVNLKKIENLLFKVKNVLNDKKSELNKLDIDYKTAQNMLNKPFEFEDELNSSTKRLDELITALNIEMSEQHKSADKPKKTHYFGKDKILGRNKSSKQLQNKTVMKSEPKRSEQEL